MAEPHKEWPEEIRCFVAVTEELEKLYCALDHGRPLEPSVGILVWANEVIRKQGYRVS